MNPDDLYGLALDRFVTERGALARALRAEGRRDEAAATAVLRKPSVAAWAVNQLVRTQGGGVQELFAAGDALRDAQADVLAGPRRRAERAESALRSAEQRRARAAQALGEADEALASAREEARAAADAHRRAQAELAEAR